MKFISERRNAIHVVDEWKRSKPCASGNLRTDGLNLFSYKTKIGFTQNGIKLVIDFTKEKGGFISHTTSVHVNMAKQVADTIVNPFQTEHIERGHHIRERIVGSYDDYKAVTCRVGRR